MMWNRQRAGTGLSPRLAQVTGRDLRPREPAYHATLASSPPLYFDGDRNVRTLFVFAGIVQGLAICAFLAGRRR
jgi:hypothetical protein